MGSVQSYEDCPICKAIDSLSTDYYYKSNEVYEMCDICGYRHYVEIVNRADIEQENWVPKHEETTIKGVGVGRIRFETPVYEHVFFDDQSYVEYFKQRFFMFRDKVHSASYTFEQDGEWFRKDLIKNTIKKIDLEKSQLDETREDA